MRLPPTETLIVILVIGLIAGWLASKFVSGSGLGLVGDVIVGLVGSFIGHWLLPRLGIHLGTGIAASIVSATIGAVVLLAVVRIIRRI